MKSSKQKETLFIIEVEKEDIVKIENIIKEVMPNEETISIVNKVALFETTMINYIINKFIEENDKIINKDKIIFLKLILEEDTTIVSLYYNNLDGENNIINGYVYSKTTLNDYE